MGLAGGIARGLRLGLAGQRAVEIIDPSALSPATIGDVLDGYAIAGTGATWGEGARIGASDLPLYAVAANAIPLAAARKSDVGLSGSSLVYGLLVNSGNSNGLLRDNDLTSLNTAWSRSNATVTLAAGGLEYDADWRGQDFTGDVQSVTGGSVSVIPDGDGYILRRIDGTNQSYLNWVVSAGKFFILTFTVENDATEVGNVVQVRLGLTAQVFPVIGSQFFNQTVTAIFYSSVDISLRCLANNHSVRISNISLQELRAHSAVLATADDATVSQTVTAASGDRVGHIWARANPANTGTVYARLSASGAEVEIPKSAYPQRVLLPLEVVENPVFRLRLTKSGDTAYVFAAASEARKFSLRPRTGPTAGTAVATGARSNAFTLAESPASLHLQFRVQTAPANIAGQTLFSVDDNAATNLVDLKANGSGGFVLRKVISSVETALAAIDIAADTIAVIEIEVSTEYFRYRIDGGSWTAGAVGIPGSLSRFRLGCDNAGAGQWDGVIWAFRDFDSTLGVPLDGF